MNSIEVLSHQVIDQIAAGEVVERPAHLIKELIENSLDAGSDSIEVDFDRGGQWVKVSDNGHGMKEGDLVLSLDRFATSKIRKADDLWKLQSFGFRGEALASISAVSHLQLVSNPHEADFGFRIESHFGVKTSVNRVSAKKGTTLVIDELFSNVPARLKFLKSEAAETAQIKTLLKAMALASPHVEMRIFQGGKLLFYWPKAKSRLERAQDVLGIEQLYSGESVREGHYVESLFSDPHTVARSSKSFWVFVQNRWVQDRSVQAAILEAYRNLLMHGEYPHVVTWIDAPLDEVDVNVHPTKSQVKFLKNDIVFKAVRDSIRPILEGSPWLKKNLDEFSQASVSSLPQDINKDSSQKPVSFEEKPPLVRNISGTSLGPSSYGSSSQGLQRTASQENLRLRDNELSKVVYKKKESLDSFGRVTISDLARLGQREESRSSGFWGQQQVLGQAFATYILTQSESQFYLIDQHAAHERVAFEKLMAARQGHGLEVQNHLVPLILDLDEDRVEALRSVEEELAKIGVHFEALSPTSLAVVASPVLLKDQHLVVGLEKMSSDLREDHSGDHLEKVLRDVFATMACHSVVRAGQILSVDEMSMLLKQMDEFPLSSFCPHGRPVYVMISKTDIEKKFGRLL